MTPRLAGAPVSEVRQEIGEVQSGYPNDQERMLLVLTNQARQSPTTPNNNECGDWTMEQGADVKKRPLVWNHNAAVGARFTARHMSELGCFQHENCCQLGDGGPGSVQCVAPGQCAGSGCNKTCDAGVGSSAQDRYALFGFSSFSGESISKNYPSAYEAWCGLMNSDPGRASIYSGTHTQLGTGVFNAVNQTCSGWYWVQAFGDAVQGGGIPAIPSASAIYSPPNPRDSSRLHFAANYFDPKGAAPKRSVVVVSGHCYDMERKWGYDDYGT